MTDPTTLHCPWCSAELPAAGLAVCPSCGATLASASGAEPDIKGVTSLDPMAIIQARADVGRPRNRLLSFITGETPVDQDELDSPESLAPPSTDVRREMLRLELEAERADLEAETVALKSDVIVEQGIHLAPPEGEEATGDATAAVAAPAQPAAPAPSVDELPVADGGDAGTGGPAGA